MTTSKNPTHLSSGSVEEFGGLKPIKVEENKPDDNSLWGKVWAGLGALGELIWKGLVIMGKISWDIMKGLFRWTMSYAKAMEKKQEQEYKKMEKMK